MISDRSRREPTGGSRKFLSQPEAFQVKYESLPAPQARVLLTYGSGAPGTLTSIF
jgi:hypothetical protein